MIGSNSRARVTEAITGAARSAGAVVTVAVVLSAVALLVAATALIVAAKRA
jgi:hypothetical protein